MMSASFGWPKEEAKVKRKASAAIQFTPGGGWRSGFDALTQKPLSVRCVTAIRGLAEDQRTEERAPAAEEIIRRRKRISLLRK